jgi:hypothetical protein
LATTRASVNVPLTIGVQLGLGSFKGADWRGTVLGLAYTPSLIYAKPTKLDHQLMLSLAAFELSVDFLDKPLEAARKTPTGKAFVYAMPPVGDSWFVLSVGGGAAWY